MRKEVDSTEEKSEISIFRPVDCLKQMLYYLKHGKIKGTTTYNSEIDNAWTWRTQEANLWSGYSNEGKSLMLKQLCLIKALEENKKFVFSSPEDYPPEEFFDDMIHTIAGITTDSSFRIHITEDLYQYCFDLIKDNFIFVYLKPPGNTIRKVLEEFREICKEEDIFGCIIDPLLKFERPAKYMEKDDQYASFIGSLVADFCRETNTSFHLVAHQLTPQFENTGAKRRYAEPSMYKVKGGGSWADGFDNVLSVWRPAYAYDKTDTEVQFSSQKIKKQKLCGIPQKIQMRFDRRKNRYTLFDYPDVDLFDFDKFLKGY